MEGTGLSDLIPALILCVEHLELQRKHDLSYKGAKFTDLQ